MGALHELGTVSLSVPADQNHVHVLRAVSASVAARLPMSIDDVDDLRLAVDEAAARLLQLPSGTRLVLRIEGNPGGLRVAISTDADATGWPDPDAKATLPWKILTALADGVAFERDGEGTACIRFRMRGDAVEVRA